MALKAPVSQGPRAKDKILGAAQNLFYEQGIRAVGVDEIVRTAGVTKPSLYRLFESKDGLIIRYLADYQKIFWNWIERAEILYPQDDKAQLIAYFDGLAERAPRPDYRGCGVTNAVVEFPDPRHPVREVASSLKKEVETWLMAKATAIGATDPSLLAAGLMLLMEGTYTTSQLYETGGPPARVGELARQLIALNCPQSQSNHPSLQERS